MPFIRDVTHWFFVQIKAEYESGEYPEIKQKITDALTNGTDTDLLRRVCEDIFDWMGGEAVDGSIQEAMVGSVALRKLKSDLLVELGFATCYDCDKRTKDLFPWKDEDGEPDGTICCQDCIAKQEGGD
jgi:hypothetical protein